MDTKTIFEKKMEKGDIGEDIIREWFESQNFIVYTPKTEGAHAFDLMAISKDNTRVYWGDVKTKPSRLYYPDTGIDIRHYNTYLNLQTTNNITFYLFFVDESTKSVYGNVLNRLNVSKTINYKGRELEYPLMDKGLIYFPLESMVTIKQLDEETVKKIASHNYRNGKYKY
jgi:hypothetical protein